MNIKKIFILVILTSALTACAGGPKVKMKDDVRHSFKTVAIDSTIDLPNTINVGSATQNVAQNFGLIGMFIGDSDKNKKTDEVQAAMEKHGIDISALVYQKMAREMAKRTPYKPLKHNSASDATMSIDVHYVGLEVAGAGTRLYPQLTVSAEMKNNKGKVIWRNRTAVGPLQKKNKAKYTYDQLISKPARIEEIMLSAAGLVAERVMADL